MIFRDQYFNTLMILLGSGECRNPMMLKHLLARCSLSMDSLVVGGVFIAGLGVGLALFGLRGSPSTPERPCACECHCAAPIFYYHGVLVDSGYHPYSGLWCWGHRFHQHST